MDEIVFSTRTISDFKLALFVDDLYADDFDANEYFNPANFNNKRDVFKIYTKESYFVPEVSDYLFFEHNLSTAEHDIPYKQRALTDLAADDKFWIFDSSGEKKRLKVLP